MVTITGLNIYPVKSLRAISLQSARLNARGFDYDREWLVIDSNNRFVTQRTVPTMATISVSLSERFLTLQHPSRPPLNIEINRLSGERVRVQIWKDRCDAIDQGNEAARWLTHVLGTSSDQSYRLVRFPQDEVRSVEPDFLAGDSSTVGFADAYPYLITVEKTLEELNTTLQLSAIEPVPMTRFRSNIVIDGLAAGAEHHTKELCKSNMKIRLALRKPCQRCKITTTDQTTGAVSGYQEPLRTLIKTNTFANKVGGYFGQNAILLSGEGQILRVGDQLDVR